MSAPKVTKLAPVEEKSRDMYAQWQWGKKQCASYSHTDHYEVAWHYRISNAGWLVGGTDNNVNYKTGGNKNNKWTFTAPANATQVKFTIRAISKVKKKAKGKKKAVYYFGGADGKSDWATAAYHTFIVWQPAPEAPGILEPVITKPDKVDAPVLGLNQVYVDNSDAKCTTICFEIWQNGSTLYTSSDVQKINNRASISGLTLAPGSSYQARARGYNPTTNEYGDWSDWSASVTALPNGPYAITSCAAASETSVKLTWTPCAGATGYEIEYSENMNYFDTGGSVSSITLNSASTTGYVTGLETGKVWYFRVRSKNESGVSAWSPVTGTNLGSKPSAPTTYSNTTTAMVGEEIILYWIHNAQDNSEQTKAQVNILVRDEQGTQTTIDIDGSTNFYKIPSDFLAKYPSGCSFRWIVRTQGIMNLPQYWSDWSVSREITVYIKPTVTINTNFVLKENMVGGNYSALDSYPMTVKAEVTPSTQKALAYVLSITAKYGYETTDGFGNKVYVAKGQEVYNKYTEAGKILNEMSWTISPQDVTLINNESYVLTVRAAMDSGLVAENSMRFEVDYSDSNNLYPHGFIEYHPDTLSTMINPVCYKEDSDEFNENVTLSVYRREHDGTFTEIATGITDSRTWVPDPHPALDYARYRIIAISNSTGKMEYYDLDDYNIDYNSVVIQWNESWNSFPTFDDDTYSAEVLFAGNMIKFPYNIDVSNSNSADVSLVEYIGREHPVSYYGTQKGETATWNVEFDKSDTETLYALRRLAAWMGDVYVREPSGSGYWAQVNVSFSQKHTELVIPVTFTITRVEGGK